MSNGTTRIRVVASLGLALSYAAEASAQALRAVPDTSRIPVVVAPPSDGPAFDAEWYTIDAGGATYLSGGPFSLGTTAGQPEPGALSGGAFGLAGGFWMGLIPGTPCYANCDGSTAPPILNVNDFTCFINHFAAGDTAANCDGSTVPPVLNVNDFACFANAFAAGCP